MLIAVREMGVLIFDAIAGQIIYNMDLSGYMCPEDEKNLGFFDVKNIVIRHQSEFHVLTNFAVLIVKMNKEFKEFNQQEFKKNHILQTCIIHEVVVRPIDYQLRTFTDQVVSNQHGYVVLMAQSYGPNLFDYYLMCVSFYADENSKLLK